MNYSEKLSGPIDYEVSRDGLFCAADPVYQFSFSWKEDGAGFPAAGS